MVKSVKIYGERNSGTNALEKALAENFSCQLIPGVTDLKREVIQNHLRDWAGAASDLPLLTESLIDNSIIAQMGKHLGWKHACPPLQAIASHPDQAAIVFVTISKDPYRWLLSFYQKPYHRLIGNGRSFSQFIRQPWLTVRRDHCQFPLLPNPIHLYNTKLASHLALQDATTNCVSMTYSDFLFQFDRVMERLSGFLTPVHEQYRRPEASTKEAGVTFDDYLQKYRKPIEEQMSDEDRAFINSQLDRSVVERAGYSLLGE